MTSTLALLILLSAATRAAPDEMPPSPAGGERASAAERHGDDDEDLSFFARFHPFALDRDLAPLVDENLVWFFAAGVLFPIAGDVWLPPLLLGETPDGYLSDALVSWLIHVGVVVACALLLGAASVAFQPLAAAVGPLIAVVVLVHAFYLAPVSSANAYHRALRAPVAAPPLRDDEAPRWMERDEATPDADGAFPPASADERDPADAPGPMRH